MFTPQPNSHQKQIQKHNWPFTTSHFFRIFAILMQTEKANTIIEKAIKSVEKDGIVAGKLIPLLQEAREFALKEEDPLLTRALRLAWQHLESNDHFAIDLAEDIEDETENFIYFLSLCVKCENEINRTELREMTNNMQALA